MSESTDKLNLGQDYASPKLKELSSYALKVPELERSERARGDLQVRIITMQSERDALITENKELRAKYVSMRAFLEDFRCFFPYGANNLYFRRAWIDDVRTKIDEALKGQP